MKQFSHRTPSRQDARQHQQTTMTVGGSGASVAPAPSTTTKRPSSYLPPASSTNKHMLGGKDLIIRMLAEVFQVSQGDDGQVRWQQVSSSLVPVSLYSRTTSKWLDYLLNASSVAAANDPANAMSPDSRDFLLLLQQFHQQARPSSIKAQFRQQQTNLEQKDFIVFQVVGHDFIDGQCKKILNVKIMQPGTRLGQASDYFVYWKERPNWSYQKNNHRLHLHQMQQQFSSSFASSTSFMPMNYRQLPAGMSPEHGACCGRQLDEPQTWGLNFASINDANLFYDICSLNLVDLDFNSEYLKQLALSDKHQRIFGQNNLVISPSSMIINHRRMQHHSQQQRYFREHSQRQQETGRFQLQRSCQLSSIKRQSSASKCPSCRQAIKAAKFDSRQLKGDEENIGMTPSDICPVHGFQSNTMRARSRSTTRHPSNAVSNGLDKRSRSHSTPASPENECPVHRRCHRLNTDCGNQVDEFHHPRCLNYIQKQHLQVKLPTRQISVTDRPQKPARGLLRTTMIEQKGYNHLQQNLAPSSQALHSKRTIKTRYMGHLPNLSQKQDVKPSDDSYGGRKQVRNEESFNGNSVEQVANDDLGFQLQSGHVSNEKQRIDNRSHLQKVEAEIDSRNADTFDAISYRDARLARARYANSKNMKEFLSLDAGGLQSTQMQLMTLNERFQRKKSSPADTQARGLPVAKRPQCQRDMDIVEQKQDVKKSAPAKQRIYSSDGERPTTDMINGSYARITTARTGDVPSLESSHVVRNVSTTTDDLPLDPQTRKRMFKLTSEEVISERTEPKSLSTASTMEQSKQQQRHVDNDQKGTREEKLDRQVRAVSLGPQMDAVRSRNARSDAGRRRSLERSTCVDFDTSLPTDSLKKFARLSPLPQSASPVAPESPKSLQSCVVDPSSTGIATLNIVKSHHHGTKLGYCSEKTAESGRDRTKRASEFYLDEKGFTTVRQNSKISNGSKISDTCQYRHCDRISTFKSAPDISQLATPTTYSSEAIPNNLGNFQSAGGDPTVSACARNLKRGQHFINVPPAIITQTIPKRTSNLSSYAVPLCTGEQEQQQQLYARQYHSCPSSLRRKRRQMHFVGGLSPGKVYPTSSSSANIADHCFCQHCQRPQAIRNLATHSPDAPRALLLGDEGRILHDQCDCFGNRAFSGGGLDFVNSQDYHKIYSSTARRHHQEYHCHHNHDHQQKQQHRHHYLGPYWANKMTDEAGSYDRRFPPMSFVRQTPDCLHSKISLCRPHSSQSTRSPLHYGLYESDYEEEKVAEDHRVNLRYSECCHDPLNRTLGYSQSTTLKPVQGYDRTLARASLKSRQRSRSQPPRSEQDAFHLSKSMENVEKLIKEVQHELDALRRHPLGAASIDMRDNESASRVTNLSVNNASGCYDPSVKMSVEESGNVGERQQSEITTVNRPKICLTSATRRAGQFKCAGAIRKAGFLSVKKWILRRRQSIELARKQGWKRYWVCLRGTALLFHSVIDKKDFIESEDNNHIDLLSWIQINCSSQLQMVTNLLQCENQQENVPRDIFLRNIAQCYIEKEPRHLIIIDGAIAQPIPEHPRRDFVFCLSTTFGDAYLFQASCQLESDNWISAMHNACAASVARDLTRDEAIKLFETKIRHLELEAEKKLFLRQRLESRLTSMSSMSKITSDTDEDCGKGINQLAPSKRVTLRSLLYRLSQQLLALDTFIEQIQCEVYQLRCYLSSCGAQRIFYQNIQRQNTNSPPTIIPNDLPHPKSLLMHVSKPTKLLLIKLGVFTVSSFHAYIHARHESADTIVQKIQQTNQQSSCPSSPLELRIRSHSISENLLSKTENIKLENDTEELIRMSNLKSVSIRIDRALYCKIKGYDQQRYQSVEIAESDTSDDRYSIRDAGGAVIINLKLNPGSSTSSIIKQVLKIIEPDLDEFDFLNYYLRLILTSMGPTDETKGEPCIAKRKDTLDDWSGFDYIELLEKTIFRIELARSRVDEEAALPYGISVEGQLFIGNFDSLLNVYCSYIEWGSVADKAGLQDEDEFVMINGIPVGDLDMMFIECIIQDATTLKLVVRSSRRDPPASSTLLDRSTWRPTSADGKSDDGGDCDKHFSQQYKKFEPVTGSQIISDEHIISLVCPPPPAQSDAFFRVNPNLLRQKSDLGVGNTRQIDDIALQASLSDQNNPTMPKSKSQHQLDDSPTGLGVTEPHLKEPNSDFQQHTTVTNSDELARQLLKKTERLTKLLGKDHIESLNESRQAGGQRADTVERFRKSILELLETEYAYIRHLETISEHYMVPLKEADFLNITDLKLLNRSVRDLAKFQRDFFDRLATTISTNCQLDTTKVSDENERLNRIVQYLDSFRTVDSLKPFIQSISQVFLSESEKFKIYASYCIAYSRLQRILHPKGISGSNLPSSSITSIPNALNTFSNSLVPSVSNISNISQQRDSMKQISSLLGGTGNGDLSSQLKHLTEFLSNLDSSSSSVSLSLPKSSVSEQIRDDQKIKLFKMSTTAEVLPANTFQKSVYQQNFESYLIKPIQRIVKYPMLLNSIALSAQIYSDEPFHKDLQCAIKQMESVISHVNDTQRVHDEYGLIFDHIERQFFEQQTISAAKSNTTQSYGPHQPPISLNIAQLLYFGSVDWLNTHEFTSKLKKGLNLTHVLFVFNSCVVFICKEQVRSAKKKLPLASTSNLTTSHQTTAFIGQNSAFKVLHRLNNDDHNEIIRYQTLIPVSEVQVRSVPADQKNSTKSDTTSKQEAYQWEMFQCSSSNSNSSLLTKSSSKRNNNGKVYLLACPTNEERSAFLRKIRFIIRESVRNMSLPLVRSPSSKSLTSKKLSISSTDSNTNTNSSCSQSASLTPNSNSRDMEQRTKTDKVNCGFTNQVEKSTKFENGIEVNN